MENKHLTEEDIQSFAVNEVVDNDIILHLSQCNECKAKYEAYKTLISSIATLQPDAFSFNVSAMVMQNIEATETVAPKNNLLYAIIGIFCIGIIIILFPFLKPIFLYILKLTVLENGLIFITFLGIATYLLSDTFRSYKKNKILLSE